MKLIDAYASPVPCLKSARSFVHENAGGKVSYTENRGTFLECTIMQLPPKSAEYSVNVIGSKSVCRVLRVPAFSRRQRMRWATAATDPMLKVMHSQVIHNQWAQ